MFILLTTDNKSKDLGETRPRNVHDTKVFDRNQQSWSLQRDTQLAISITNNPPSGKTNTFIEYIWSIHYIGQWIKTLAHIMYSSQQRNLYFTTVSYVWKIYDLTTLWLYNGSIKTIHIITWRILDKLKQTMSTRFKNSSKLSCLLDGMLHVFKHT